MKSNRLFSNYILRERGREREREEREKGRERERGERERERERERESGFSLYLMLDCYKGFRFILLQVNVLNINPAWLNQHSQR